MNKNGKGKRVMAITIGIMFFILTIVIFVQIKTIGQINVSEFQSMRRDQLETEIQTLQTQIDETETEISKTNELIESEQEAYDLLLGELERTENLLGTKQVNGEGVIITMESDKNKVHARDLLELINLLKNAGAEAISLNDQRIVYESYIADLEDKYITVNGNRIGEPFVIKAIGNTSHLESGVAQKRYGYIDVKIAAGLQATLEKSNLITIYAYNKSLDFEYVKEEE